MDKLKKLGEDIGDTGDIYDAEHGAGDNGDFDFGEIGGDIGLSQGNWDRVSFDQAATLHHPPLMLQVDHFRQHHQLVTLHIITIGRTSHIIRVFANEHHHQEPDRSRDFASLSIFPIHPLLLL